jgi:hypothetical protein
MEKRIVTLHIRVSEKTAAALKKLAEADHRAVAGYISMVLDKHVAELEKQAEKPKGKKPQ